MEIPAELIQKYPSLKKFEDANYVEVLAPFLTLPRHPKLLPSQPTQL